MSRLVVVANLAAGATRADDARRTAILEAFAAWDASPSLLCVPGHQIQQACRQAVGEGAEVVVAAGGDGTVSAVAGAVAGTRAALAVLPMGTLNHFAKDVGIPLDLEEAAQVALRGDVQAVDAAQVNGRVFVNNASIGLYPEAVRVRERHRGGGSKRLATVRAAGTVLRHVPAHHLRLAIDGHPAVRTTSFLFVGNNAYETSLAGLGSRPSLTGGRLSVYTVRRPGRRAVLALAARALVGRLDQAHDFEAHAARELVVDCHRPGLRVALDGELCTLETPLRFTTRPQALRVLRPPRADADGAGA